MTGRPSSFTQEKADIICERIAGGESLRSICQDEGMPSFSAVMRWLGDESNSTFRNQYARAREAQADFMTEDILSIADEECTMVRAEKHSSRDDDGNGNTEVIFDATAVARNRLRVDARKWLASKLAPKKYGDKVQQEVTGPDGGPVNHSIKIEFIDPPQ